MVRINFIGMDDLNGIEEEKGSSLLRNINPDGKKDHPLQRQSGEVSDAQRASKDVCEASSSPINSVILGDCLEKLKTFPDNTVDQLVTDPPYGYSFMGKDWDKAVPRVEIWKECLRVLKPGAFAFIMSSPRQDVFCRNLINIEKAGFRTDFTSLFWTYASGFPKAHNISKAVDKKFGAERKIIARNPNSRENCDKSNTILESGTVGKTAYITEPATEKARRLDGSYAGFQPKPAVEVIIVAMKPLDEKGYTDQALSNSKGITWLDDCRIPYKGEKVWSADSGVQWSPEREWNSDCIRAGSQNGRFPSNLLVSDDVLDTGKNEGCSTKKKYLYEKGNYGIQDKYVNGTVTKQSRCFHYGDTGSYSRFFSLDSWAERNLPFLIVPKASPKEKKAGLDESISKKDLHPTVKPVKLMAYLITMGSRVGDVVLDPFCGSGTTCMAAKMLRRNYVGIELSRQYHEIALKRIDYVKPIGGERKIYKDISGSIIQNLKLIVGQQLRNNPIGVKIALKYYANKISEIKRRYSVVDIFEEKEKGIRSKLADLIRNEARRFVEPIKNGAGGSEAKIEIRIKNTPEVAGLCLVIKKLGQGFSPEAKTDNNLNTSDRNEFEVQDLIPYLPSLLGYA